MRAVPFDKRVGPTPAGNVVNIIGREPFRRHVEYSKNPTLLHPAREGEVIPPLTDKSVYREYFRRCREHAARYAELAPNFGILLPQPPNTHIPTKYVRVFSPNLIFRFVVAAATAAAAISTNVDRYRSPDQTRVSSGRRSVSTIRFSYKNAGTLISATISFRVSA